MNKPTLSTIIFEVTQACNHGCLYCYNYWNHPAWKKPALNSPKDVRPLLAHVLEQIECHHVTLTGGEPLLRTDLPEIVSFLQKRFVDVTVISNGHLLTDDLATDLIHRGAGFFELPLLSWRRKVHDHLSGSAGAFDAALGALANIRFHGGRAVAVVVATRLNLPDLYDTIKLAFGFGASGVMLNRFNPGGRGAAQLDDLIPTVSEMKAGLAAAETAATDFGIPVSCSIPIQPCLIDTTEYRHLSFGFCAAGSDRAYYTLDTAGYVRPCNHSPTILGNVWEDDFANIINSPCLSDFTAAVPAFCTGCDWQPKCQGGCKAAAQVCYGSLQAEEPFLRRNLDCARPIRGTDASRTFVPRAMDLDSMETKETLLKP